MTMNGAAQRRWAIGWAALLGAGAVAEGYAYWPGIMIWDAIRQYGQARIGRYDDWHPPAMAWLWRQLGPIAPGPAPMLILQLALYWGGFALLAAWAARRGRPWQAAALAAAALLPIPLALMGAVVKDSLMAGALLVATGLLAWAGRERRPGLRIAGVALILFAGTLRFNALLAGVPLVVALLSPAWRRTRLRLLVSTAISALALAAALPLANRALDTVPSGVDLSLIIYDLGGITQESGVDAFPNVGVANPVAVNRGCYDPRMWDPYAWWVNDPCPIGWGNVGPTLKAEHRSPVLFWAEAILRHPIAYAEHRLRHFNRNSRFLVHGSGGRPIFDITNPNPWGVAITPNPLLRWIDRAARWSALTPLGWPIAWMALALGLAIVAPGMAAGELVLPVALSALLYGAGYLVLSVASEMRYQLWTMSAALIALLLAAPEMGAVPRRRLGLAFTPLALVLLLAIAYRLQPWW